MRRIARVEPRLTPTATQNVSAVVTGGQIIQTGSESISTGAVNDLASFSAKYSLLVEHD